MYQVAYPAIRNSRSRDRVASNTVGKGVLSVAQLTSPNNRQQTVLGKSASNAGDSQVTTVDLARIRYGACLIGAAFVLLGVVFGVSIMQFKAASDVVAVVGSVATVVGTIVASFFGIQAAASSKAAAEAGRAHAEQTARLALGKLDPQAAEDVLKRL